MKKYVKLLGVILISGSSSSLFAGENLFECQTKYPFIWGNCALVDKELSAQPNDQGVAFHAQFSVTYSFNCSGHETDFGFASGSSFKRLNMGADHAVIHEIIGEQPLKTLDPNPSLTGNLSFQPGCSLEVHDVTYSPSVQTLRLWDAEASGQARVLGLSIELYEVARDFTSYRDWDTQKTLQMIQSLDGKISLYEKRCESNPRDCITKAHFIVLRNSLQAKLDQTPNLPNPADMSEEINSVVTHYLEELNSEVEKALAMKSRFERWQLTILAELEEALSQVP